MILRFGTHDVATILEDGSVTVNLPAVTAALKQARNEVYPNTNTDGPVPVVCMTIDGLVALQALAGHKHAAPKTLRQRLKEWL